MKEKIYTLDSLRGVCAIFVVLYHSAFVYSSSGKTPFIANSDVFVDFFFILSGFVMSMSYENRIAQGVSFLNYSKKRFLRLYPLHIVTLFFWVFFILSKYVVYEKMGIGSTDPTINNNGLSLFLNLLFIHALKTTEYLSWNTPSWSISVEFAVYIIFFLYIKLLSRYKKFRVFLAFVIVLLLYLYLISLFPNSILRTYDYGLERCIAGFFLGYITFKTYEYKNNKFNFLKLKPIIANVIDVSLLVVGYMLISNINGAYSQFCAIIFFSVVILYLSTFDSGVVSRVLNISFFRYVGMISFSVYMVHALILALASNVYQYILGIDIQLINGSLLYVTKFAPLINALLIAIIIGISSLSYKYVEKRDWSKVLENKRLYS
ncbi:putative Acyl_transf_3 domain-containing protein [Vibrio chagasii]|nr:putative Acyl_transf_3 domain-containing protein [Vibrio chagasii]CAH7176442.1 putative Acyl_transf_3 domain-containing protein [Vibrio chagasii]CAH7244240.1 putative Acyl_transf_3 domain-containing protein [Vibrio chagasii]CAH7376489.1 putative Acyl_transf_3 domain-containing protein [Vibrio chagasii]